MHTNKFTFENKGLFSNDKLKMFYC